MKRRKSNSSAETMPFAYCVGGQIASMVLETIWNGNGYFYELYMKAPGNFGYSNKIPQEL